MLSFASEVYIYFPGGFGTLDEFFEILTHVQTGKIARVPIILVGHEYWDPLVAWFKSSLLDSFHAIHPHDFELFYVVADAEEAHAKISSFDTKVSAAPESETP
jgi:uncharacterized protein (TIGR00730 family)